MYASLSKRRQSIENWKVHRQVLQLEPADRNICETPYSSTVESKPHVLITDGPNASILHVKPH